MTPPPPLEVRPLAERDVDELALHIGRDSPESAVRFLDALEASYQNILSAPLRWPVYGFVNPRLADLRKGAVVDFEDRLIFYRVLSDRVQIFRVVHGARDLPKVLLETA